ncbi:MAG: DUF2911 domain-containing protein [Bacteroidetes bacterium]|nr:MAG: DUF2911 domain-containing protein [Bacteroidota bacterium]
MKKLFLSVLSFSLISAATAQPDLPAPSPKAMVMQTVGLTDITIEYSSPAVNGRTIFGGLVPYDSLWRTGANAATKITFSEDVKVGSSDVKAGTYSIFTIPGKTEWTFIINSDYAQSGTSKYDKAKDVLRLTVKSETIASKERMAFSITNFSEAGGNITLEWSTVQINVPFTVSTAAQAQRNIDRAVGGTWRVYAQSARYMLEHDGDMNKALELINQSVSLSEGWYNTWIKAQILHKLGKKKEALAAANRAYELGNKTPEGFFYKSQVEKALNDWK